MLLKNVKAPSALHHAPDIGSTAADVFPGTSPVGGVREKWVAARQRAPRPGILTRLTLLLRRLVAAVAPIPCKMNRISVRVYSDLEIPFRFQRFSAHAENTRGN